MNNKMNTQKKPILLFAFLSSIGNILLVIGILALFDIYLLLPENLRFPSYEWTFITIGAMIDIVATIILLRHLRK